MAVLCPVVWDGVDFTDCFKARVLDNLPLVLVAVAGAYLLVTRLIAWVTRGGRNGSEKITASSLVSPTGESNLAKLESTVLMAALAANVLPEDRSKERLSPEDAEQVVQDFGDASGRAGAQGVAARTHKLELVGRIITALGGLAYMGVGIAGAIATRRYRDLAFPIFIGIAGLIPDAPVPTLLSIHLVPTLLLLRSTLIRPHPPAMRIVPTAIELAYWLIVISIPYGDRLDGLLKGKVSNGGGSLGSFGAKLPRHEEQPTSVFGRATYTYLIPFMVKHFFKTIKLADIPSIREDDSAAAVLAAYRADQAHWDERYAHTHPGQKRQRDLMFNLFRFFAPLLVKQVGWALLFTALQYTPPTALRLLLQFVKNREVSDQPTHVAYVYVAMMAAGQCFGIMSMAQCLYIGRRVCVRSRAIIVAEVFTKALRRQDLAGNVSKKKTSAVADKKDGNKAVEEKAGSNDGRVVNLVSNDAFMISEVFAYTFYLVSCPVAVIVNLALLYNALGIASLAGIAVIVLLIPVQTLIAKLYMFVQGKLMGATDTRLEAVTEVIAHIKLIKFNAWESKFFDRMSITRRAELRLIAQKFAIVTLNQTLVWGMPVIVTTAAFSVHSLVLHKPLTADGAFASLILFNMLRDPLGLVQDTIARMLQARTSCIRIQQYLDEPDTPKYQQLSHATRADEPKIGFRKALIGYQTKAETADDEYEPFRLGKLDIAFPVGQLSLIVGPVGCGKSTLVNSLLGETTLLEGQIFMPDDRANRDVCAVDPVTGLTDTVAYCAQTAWLIGASIRENIVFGSPWDKQRYDAVVDACALRRDFEIFDLGDATEVGEKGTTCSGGQKARIALARAVYSRAATVILDDVLSAVDAQTARHLYVHVLQGCLMKNRTCILVTHAVALVAPAASLVVMLDAGQVVAAAPRAELIRRKLIEPMEEIEPAAQTSSTSTLVSPSSSSSPPPNDIIEENLDGVAHDALETKKHLDAEAAEAVANGHAKHRDTAGGHDHTGEAPQDTSKDLAGKQLVAEEAQGEGSIGWATYSLYFRSMGGMPYWVVLIAILLIAQALQIINNAWIRDWANASDQGAPESSSYAAAKTTAVHAAQSFMAARQELRIKALSLVQQGHGPAWYLGVYVALSAAYLLSLALRVGINYGGSLLASKLLYTGLLKRILGAKMRFFDATPSGRIINRLSKDMFSIDNETGEILMYFINCILSVVSVIIVIVFSTPVFAFALVGIVLLYVVIGSLYIVTSREIKRYDSVTRSPLFISFSEVLVGMSTIRSYGDAARFTTKILHELDQNTRCFWYLWQTNRVLHNFSVFGGAIVTVLASVFALQNRAMDAGAVGLSITYALSFNDYVLWIVRMYAACEMSMNSVERVGEYLNLEVEEEETKKGIEPPAYWPTRDGSVVVENLTCKYAPQLDPVLKDVSFTIGPKEKIGICGRTGSGKSTLALSFFRFLHQEGGSIYVDGLDIAKLSLSTLRSRLTILPQEAQLFSGTIRDNLDPFNEHEDADIWEALSKCGLSGRTPAQSRLPSRAGSRADLTKLASAAGAAPDDLRKGAMAKAAAAANSVARQSVPDKQHKTDDIDDDEEASTAGSEVTERIMIRSLDEQVAVGGKNFSQGQRQLLALARGLLKLRHSSFLIMDESTANLDHATDQTIQHVLRTSLADTQMLVIAHRLMTVCGLDKILVLDHGRVVEFGTPYELMQDERGSFRDLCRQSAEEAQLLELARSVHEAKQAGA